MRRRVSIARAIISNPGPDPVRLADRRPRPDHVDTIIELVMKQRDVSHTTSLVVTHRLQDAFTMATHRYDAKQGMIPIAKDGPERGIDSGMKFLMLNEGRIVFNGTTEELVHTDDPWIKEFLS
jgi:phospholipid/cholesterol/gamma-HCH transport system ATP-binding protein